MLRRIRILILVSGLFLTGFQAFSQEVGRLGPPIMMSLQSPLVSGDFIKIQYDIPYDGYIIFDLFKPSGEKIWSSSSVKLKGTHVHVFKRDPLVSGEKYSFNFWYKGKKYSGKFTNT